MGENDILKDFREILGSQLGKGGCTIDDIERMMGEAKKKFNEELVSQTEELIEQSTPESAVDQCPGCGRDLKKTK